MADLSDEELLDALGVNIETERKSPRTPREERIIAGFEEIQKFAGEHGRAPLHGENRDIFERLYAVRLDRLRALPDCRELLAGMDRQGLLHATAETQGDVAEEGDDDALLAELGVDVTAPDDITKLKHVRPTAEKRIAEEIGSRKVCKDFERFKPLFIQVQKELDADIRRTRPFEKMDEIKLGEFFIVGGQKAYVAEVGEEFVTEYDRRDSRLRVIYDNGTESDVRLRSLQRALHKDSAGRRITNPSAGPLFAGEADEQDRESGTIYVLRSRSDHPAIAANRDLIHKIGVTGGELETRLAIAKLDPTYLLAEVDIIATYELFNINRSKLEKLIHRFFSPARLDLQIEDRFGNPVKPREWYLVPLPAIDEAVAKIRDGSITRFD
ncbi:MAG: GIY-YIG nuclease family protein, partial [Methylocella sp.]